MHLYEVVWNDISEEAAKMCPLYVALSLASIFCLALKVSWLERPVARTTNTFQR